jgi:acetyl/propionyl-CoA carboxylase alpha subunit
VSVSSGRRFESLLVANRGEIAIRVLRAASELGLRTVAVHAEDDAASLHVVRADAAQALPGKGAAAYLDIEAVVEAARAAGCQAVHPGYGFLSENPRLARACSEAGIVFVGPPAEILQSFGDKVRCREIAERGGVPVLAATGADTTLADAVEFRASLGPDASVMIKAARGGGGRGMRRVDSGDDLEAAFERCQSEAERFFGSGEVYVEERVRQARHVEVQIVGDGSVVSHLYERECTLQRAHQKLVEIAPSPSLPAATRERLFAAAVGMARELAYESLGTFEFLVDAENEERFAFIEANPRLQVEHTVTEEVTGVDLVRAQLEIAAGRSLADLGLLQADVPAPRGHAIQCRINSERMDAKGRPLPSGGTLSLFEPPTGPGLRTDTCGHAGFTTHPGFDSLLAKLVAHSASARFEDAVARTCRGLSEFRIEGVSTNLGFLRALLEHPDVAANRITTTFVETHAADLARSAARFDSTDAETATTPEAPATELAGARIDTSDPLAVLDHGRSQAVADAAGGTAAPRDGSVPVPAPVQGTIVSVSVSEGDTLLRGAPLLVMEAMKMEHVVTAPVSGRVARVQVVPGDTVFEAHALVFILEDASLGEVEAESAEVDLERVRPDLQEVMDRHAKGYDENRPKAVERRRETGQRTARENVHDLCDAGSFVEYGALALAAQRRRRSLDDLMENTPGDGMVAGVGSVNGALFPDADARCVILSYDYTVLAGTQGTQNHRKKDRMFEIADEWRLPVVIFTEGGGGRPGDTDGVGTIGLDCWAFQYFGALSGLVPLVGINSGRCFAGNAALLGCCDVVIATENSNIGMGGPAMIEGGGLGIFRPEEVGPMDVQVRNGVVDIAVSDEAEAVEVAKRYLAYFQGRVGDWDCADQRLLRSAIPENRLRIYDVRRVIETLADSGSVLELRRGFGPGMVTALARVEGRPIGIVANDPMHLAGAIDSDGADKASRFMQLCDAFDVPILFLCDTPGIMVGPEAEKSGTVRHASRMFVVGGSLTVPFFTIVLRKGYGLGAQAMAGGSFKAPFFCVSWPTGEFGGMGLEGAVKLGYRKELEAETDPEARRALYEKMVAAMYAHGKAVSAASYFELDDVIDPADSRLWIGRALRSVPPTPPRDGKKRPCVDAW